MSPEENNTLEYDGDNAWYVIKHVIPHLKLSDKDKVTLIEAYAKGYEQISDGETGVKDEFLDGKIKSPAGVGHDYITRVLEHITDDGHRWTKWEANAFYRRTKKATGSGFRVRWRRWAFLTATSYWWK